DRCARLGAISALLAPRARHPLRIVAAGLDGVESVEAIEGEPKVRKVSRAARDVPCVDVDAVTRDKAREKPNAELANGAEALLDALSVAEQVRLEFGRVVIRRAYGEQVLADVLLGHPHAVVVHADPAVLLRVGP